MSNLNDHHAADLRRTRIEHVATLSRIAGHLFNLSDFYSMCDHPSSLATPAIFSRQMADFGRSVAELAHAERTLYRQPIPAPEAVPALPAPEMLALPAPAPALPWRKRNRERYNAYHRAYQTKRRVDAKALAQAEAAADRFRFLTGRRMRKLNLLSEHGIAFRAALASATTSKEAIAAYRVARSHHMPA